MMTGQSYSAIKICQFLLLLVKIYNTHLDLMITSVITFPVLSTLKACLLIWVVHDWMHSKFSSQQISILLFCKYNKRKIFLYRFIKYLVAQKFFYLSYEYLYSRSISCAIYNLITGHVAKRDSFNTFQYCCSWTQQNGASRKLLQN